MRHSREQVTTSLMSQTPSQVETIIRPPRRFAQIDLAELWAYRNLFRNLITRRLKTQFQEQALPWLWVVARPLIMLLVFVVFRHISNARTGVNIPYPLYLYSGLILWFYFLDAVSETALSIRQEVGLMSKVYFPRILAPLAAIAASTVRFAINILPLAALMFIFGEFPGWRLLLLPVVMIQLWLLIFGLGSLFAGLGVSSADWERFLGFSLYIGLFISPVMYAPSLLPHEAQIAYGANPMVGALMGFRSALFDGAAWPTGHFIYAAAFSVAIAIIGLLFFQWTEKHFVDKA
jgi:lipopolysaccharide transport system permease protein